MLRALSYDGYWLMAKRLSKGRFSGCPSVEQPMTPASACRLRQLIGGDAEPWQAHTTASVLESVPRCAKLILPLGCTTPIRMSVDTCEKPAATESKTHASASPLPIVEIDEALLDALVDRVGEARTHNLALTVEDYHTCETYSHALKLWFLFTANKLGISPSALQLEHLDAATVTAFCLHLEKERGNTGRTINSRLATVKAYIRFIEYRVPDMLDQVRQIRAIPRKKIDEVLVGYLNREQVEAILNSPQLKTRAGIRDRAMMHLCLSTGLRVSELVTLPLSAVTLHAEPSVHVMGRGRRERALPLRKVVADDLRAWRDVRGDSRISEYFLNVRGRCMTRSGFEYLLRKHVSTASLTCTSLVGKRVSPHVLRHYLPFLTISCKTEISSI